MKKLGKMLLTVSLSIVCAASLVACTGATANNNDNNSSTINDEIDSKDDTDANAENNASADNDATADNGTFSDNDTNTNEELLSGTHHAEIVVQDYGTIYVELDADTAPITVTNFVNLANSGFYDGLTFMRVMEGFMIQGGDPNKDCTGGSDTTIKGEFASNGVENNISHKRGTISMARSSISMDSASSQFFICNADADFLDGDYAAFGTVTDGMDVVDAITTDFAVWNGVIYNKDIQPVITTIKIVD